MLACVLLTAGDGSLHLGATDLSLSIGASVPAGTDGPGSLAIPARLLTEFVGSLPSNGMLTLESGKANRVRVTCGTYEANIAGMDPEDWPAPTEIVGPTLALPAVALRAGISQVVDCCAKEETRPALTGVLWKASGDTLTLAAADGFRLARKTLTVPEPVEGMVEAIIPRTTMDVLEGLLAGVDEPVGVQVGTANVRVTGPGWSLTSRKIEGSFPNYEQIIPTSHTTRVVVGRKALAEAVKIANLFAREGSDIVRLDIGETGLVMSAIGVDTGDSRTNLACELSGDPLKIAFNGKYLASILAVMPGEQVSLEATRPGRPGLWRAVGDESGLWVLMPMSTKS